MGKMNYLDVDEELETIVGQLLIQNNSPISLKEKLCHMNTIIEL